MKNNCMNCEHGCMKDLFKDGSENVLICGKDNRYIGYPEDAEKEKCDEYEKG